jgi:KDO2-lipid IV(A) lauroyltransferase
LQLRYRLEYAVYKAGKALLATLPESAIRRLGPVAGRIGYRLDRRHRKVAYDNLQLAYPSWSESQREDLAVSAFENFGRSLVSGIAYWRLDKPEFLERLEMVGAHHIFSAEARDRGVIFLTAHLGNWEALPQLTAIRNRPMSFVVRPLDNPYIERDLKKVRERFGNKTIAKRSAALKMMRILRNKGRVGILIDQRVHPREGRAYPFFGRPAFTTLLPAQLSLRTGAPVIPVFALPQDDWRRFKIVITKPIYPPEETTRSSADELTTQYLDIMEQAIRKYPELWLWMHRRWRVNPTKKKRRPGASDESKVPSPAKGKETSTDSTRPTVAR